MPRGADDDTTPLITVNGEEEDKDSLSSHMTPILALSVFGCVIGCGFTMGYNTSVLNNPGTYIEQFFSDSYFRQTGNTMTPSMQQNMYTLSVSIYCLAAPIGAFAGTAAAKRFGRKPTILANNLLALLGGLIQAWCVTLDVWQLLIIGRVIVGMNNGANTAIGPMYLSEISPRQIRGAIGVTFQLSVTIGVLVSEVVSFDMFLGSEENWPELFNVLLLASLAQVAIIPFCPESPRFLLIERGDEDGCRSALTQIRAPSVDIEEDIEEMKAEDRKQKEEPPVSWAEMFQKGYLRRALIVSVIMAMSQQLSGINAVNYYSSTIFTAALSSSFPDLVIDHPDVPKYLTAFTGLVLVLTTVVSVGLIEKVGRKRMHLLGLSGMNVSALIIAFMLSNVQTEDDQTCQGINFGNAGNYIAIVCVLSFIAFFSLGPGSIPWLITPELFSESPRPKAVAIATTMNWLCNASVGYFFPLIQSAICGWVFLVFVFLLTYFCIYLYIRLPETSGLTIDEITALFEDDRKYSIANRRKSFGFTAPDELRHDLAPVSANQALITASQTANYVE